MKYLRRYSESKTYSQEDILDIFLELDDVYRFKYSVLKAKIDKEANDFTLSNTYIYDTEYKKININIHGQSESARDVFLLNVGYRGSNNELFDMNELNSFVDSKEDILDTMGLKIHKLYAYNGNNYHDSYFQIRLYLITGK